MDHPRKLLATVYGIIAIVANIVSSLLSNTIHNYMADTYIHVVTYNDTVITIMSMHCD